jgi:hypothetical protein
MKKILLSLGMLAGIISAASAQQARFGVKGGVGLASVTGDDVYGAKRLFGFQAGVMADFGFSESFSFHPELLYSQKGTKRVGEDVYSAGGASTTSSYSAKARLHYLDLPLLVRAKLAGFFVELGPQVGLLLGQRAQYTTVTNTYGPTGTLLTSDTENEVDTRTDDLRKLDVGYVVGLGYSLPLGLEAGVRYNGGITKVVKGSTDSKVYNSVIQFQLGYLFGGK